MQSAWPDATVWVDPNSLPADGAHEATVWVDMGPKFGSGAGAAAVTLVSSDPYALVRQPDVFGGGNKTSGGVRATRPGVQIITAWLATGDSIDMVGQPVSVTFTAPGIDGNGLIGATGDPVLSLVAAHGIAAADASEPALFVLTVNDRLGRPLANRAVSLRPSRPGDQVAPTEAVTDAQGRVEITLTSVDLGTGSILASMGPISTQASVAFIAGPPQAAQSTLQPRSSGVRADGAETLGFDVQVRDASGQPVPYATVVFSSSAHGDVLSPRTAVTDATGLCTSWLRGTQAGPRTVTAALPHGALTAVGSLVAGAASASASTLLISPNAVLADGMSPAALMLTVRDAFGNVIPNAAVTWGADGSLNSFTPATSMTDASGMASATVRSIRAQSQNVLATCGAAHILAPLVFEPGPLDANLSSLSVSADAQPANGQSPVTLAVYLRDAWGNGIPNVPLELSHFGNPAQLFFASGLTGPAGMFTTTLTSAYAGTHLISAQSGNVRLVGAAHFVPNAPSCAGNFILGGPPATQVGPGDPLAAAVAADLDGDGHLDLITTNGKNATLSVLLGQGNGTFRDLESYAVGQTPRGVAVADFNDDGALDVVTANYTDKTISVLINQGNGVLGVAISSSTGAAEGPSNVAVANFNEDGFKDVLTTSYFSNKVSLLRGQGDGTFAPASVLSVSNNWLGGVAVGDLNHDGHQDFIVSEMNGSSVWVLLGLGDGNLASAVAYGVGGSPDKVVMADFNGDGHVDVASANGDGTVSIILGRGDGTFGAAQNLLLGQNLGDLLVADLNADENVDLVVFQRYPSMVTVVTVLLGDGSSGFLAPKTQTIPVGPMGGREILVTGDFFGDGHLDLLTATSDDTVVIGQGLGDGNFFKPFDLAPSFPAGNFPENIFTGDFDGDGQIDVAVTNYTDGVIDVLLAQQGGGFLAPVTYPVGQGAAWVDGSDLNGDGQIDLVVANWDAGTICVLMGQSSGAFAAAVTYYSGDGARHVKVADINGDDLMDAIVVNADYSNVAIFIGQGDGSLLPAVKYPVGDYPVMVALADLNGDEQIDVITADSGGGTVSVLLGQGNGILSVAVPYQAGADPEVVAVGDVNEDGLLDVVTLGYHGELSVLLGAGDGSLLPASVWPLHASNVQNGWVEDFDGDGHLDVIALHHTSVSVLLGRGDGTFTNPSMFLAAQSSISGGAVADMNHDGRVDLLTSDHDRGQVNMLLNMCASP